MNTEQHPPAHFRFLPTLTAYISRGRCLATLTITFKVLGSDTGDALLIVENISHGKGGPPRHVHHDQDEWFYAVEGEFVVEIGDETFPCLPAIRCWRRAALRTSGRTSAMIRADCSLPFSPPAPCKPSLTSLPN